MTREEFVKYQSGVRNLRMPAYVPADDSKIILGQACSVQELFERQAQGLPIPELSGGYSFNGRTVDELTPADRLGADKAEIYNEYQRLQSDVSKEVKRGKPVVKPKEEPKNV